VFRNPRKTLNLEDKSFSYTPKSAGSALEAWLEVYITFVSGLFVVVVESTGVLAFFSEVLVTNRQSAILSASSFLYLPSGLGPGIAIYTRAV